MESELVNEMLRDSGWVNNSADLKKRKTELKRTVSAIRKQHKRLAKLLTQKEETALIEAGRALDSFVGRVERAANQMKNEEEAKELVRQQRCRQAVTSLNEKYKPSARKEYLITAMALYKAMNYRSMIKHDIYEEMNFLKQNPEHQWCKDAQKYMDGIIKDYFNKVIKKIVSDIEWGHKPVNEMLSMVFDAAEFAIDEIKEQTTSIIKDLNTFLVQSKIEQANKNAK